MSYAPPTWLQQLFNLTREARLIETVYNLYSWILGGSVIFCALITVLGSFACYLRGGLTAVSVFLLLTGAVFSTLLPPEVHTFGQIILVLGIAVLLYKVVTREE